MIAQIRAVCPDCGDVVVTVDDVDVLLWPADVCSYSFRCPTCAGANAKRCASRVAHQLVEAGCRVTYCCWPDEPHPNGPPLDTDALIDFAVALHDCDDIVGAATI